MLRRYLIVNGITTAVLYGSVWAFVPSVPSLMQAVSSTIDTLAMQSPLLGPVINRIILVSSGL